ncbi:MAG: hypothetical protein WEC12_02155 [Balneolaceae bacterium]
MIKIKTDKYISLALALFIIPLAGCNTNNTDDEQPLARAEFGFQLLEGDSREPITDTDVSIATEFVGEEESIDRGVVVTDSEGRFDGYIITGMEETISTFIFTLSIDGTDYVIEEEAELELRYGEDLDNVDLEVLVATGTGE